MTQLISTLRSLEVIHEETLSGVKQYQYTKKRFEVGFVVCSFSRDKVSRKRLGPVVYEGGQKRQYHDYLRALGFIK